jgi:signal transduction histidine kinase
VTEFTLADNDNWLLWLEDGGRCAWSLAESAALTLAGQALAHAARAETAEPLWVRQIWPARRGQRLEQTVAVVQRLAHDFGNFLTSIQGFTQLAQGQLPPASPAHCHLTEVLRAAEGAARVTERLRLFSRRGAARARPTPLGPLLAEEIGRLRESWGSAVRLQAEVSDDLPPLRIDRDLLREVLAAVLENGREAIAGPGTVNIAARPAELSQADCLGLFGNPAAGPCVEVAVRDTGCGIAPEVRRRLMAEPFFSNKPRHRGLGLAVVYGVLYQHKGGFRLDPGPEGGTVVRLFLPAASDAESRPGTQGPGDGERCAEQIRTWDFVLGTAPSPTAEPGPSTMANDPARRTCQSPRIDPVPQTSATYRL